MPWTDALALITTTVVVLALTAALCVRIAARPLADAIVRLHDAFGAASPHPPPP